MKQLLTRATDIHQYDNPNLPWNENQDTLKSPNRAWMFSFLSRFSDKWEGKVVDIGCGTGWLVNEISKVARFAIGIDPSKRNCDRGRKLFPSIHLENKDLFSFSEKDFDLAIAVMVFIHISDLEKAFRHVNKMLKRKGEFQLIIPDYEYFRRPRDEVTIKEINSDECVMEIRRETGTVADIVRKQEIYLKIAKECDFTLIEHVPMLPSKELINNSSKYGEFSNKPILHLFRFIKV